MVFVVVVVCACRCVCINVCAVGDRGGQAPLPAFQAGSSHNVPRGGCSVPLGNRSPLSCDFFLLVGGLKRTRGELERTQSTVGTLCLEH